MALLCLDKVKEFQILTMVWPDRFHTHIRPQKPFSCHNGFISILFVGADSSLKNSSGLTAQQMALTSDMKKTIKVCEKKVCVDILSCELGYF